ncbi:MAG: endonuclease III [Candidatus Omnitrophota bacterium]
MSNNMNKKTAFEIYKILEKKYPRVTTALVYAEPLQLLVATILSAQCTDKRVNIVTESIFKKYKSVKKYAKADIAEFEREIKSTGFYKNKAKNIISSANMIMDNFNGKVPDTMEDLVKLPGVARKTANIVLVHGFGKIEGIAVDTHVRRVSARLGFTKNTDPVKIEKDLIVLFDKEKWGKLSNLLIQHGRKTCSSRTPNCPNCAVKNLCPSVEEFDNNK